MICVGWSHPLQHDYRAGLPPHRAVPTAIVHKGWGRATAPRHAKLRGPIAPVLQSGIS
jgi:hypothetical protein